MKFSLMAPVGEDGSDTGGAVDRGDTFVPTEHDEVVETGTEQDDDALVEEIVGEADKPRTADGKFAKKERTEEEPRIPKSRFDTAVAKERARAEAAERRLAEIDAAQSQIQRNVELSELEKNVRELRAQEHQAILLGKTDEAGELAARADLLNRQISLQQAGAMSAADRAQVREEIRMEQTLTSILEQYPFLDEKSEDFDQDLVDDINDKQQGLMNRERMPPSKALAEAVKRVMRGREQQAPAEPRKAALGAPVQGRKEAAVAKNLDASRRQPANTRVGGADSNKYGQTSEIPNGADMTVEEFAALPAATRARMRGDFV